MLSSSHPVAIGPKTYRVGTLVYTLRGVSMLFVWLLWGDFASAFFSSVFGNFLPLYLKDLQASNTLIGVMMGSIGGIIMTILSYFFIHDMPSLLTLAIIGNLIATAGAISGGTFTMQIFPHAKFGQFFAATNIFGYGIGVLGNYLADTFMDVVHSNYRMAYLWMLIGGLSLIPTLLVYRDWKRFGGPDHYEPPLPPE